jgi:putative membrane protein
MALLAAAAQDALRAAAADVEARSAAEVVIVVRRQSGSYRDVDLSAGVAAGLLLLWYQLFSPVEFSLGSILWGPPLLGAVVAFAVSRWPTGRRLLTTAGRRRLAVREAACAVFVERGLDATRGRTGLLVFVSQLERAVEVLGDRGLRAAVPEAEWQARTAALQAAVSASDPWTAVAVQVRSLGDVLARVLPRAHDDADELADEVVA